MQTDAADGKGKKQQWINKNQIIIKTKREIQENT